MENSNEQKKKFFWRMEGPLKKRCVSECVLFGCPDENLVIIVGKLGGNDRLRLLCTCTEMHDLVLAVCPPWSHTKYYEQWAKEAGPERWSPDARLLESALNGPAQKNWPFMLSLLEDERVWILRQSCAIKGITGTGMSWSFFG
jgi:hypothetical protein